MKTFIKTFLIAALLVSFTADIQAQRYNQFNQQQAPGYNQMGQFNNFGPMRGVPQQRMIALLDLSEEQQEQVKQHWLEGQEEMLPLRNELREKRARLQTLRTSADYDKSAVNSLIQEIGELETNMMLLREEHRQEMRSFLTAEQKVIFDAHRLNRGNRGSRGMRGTGRSGNFCRGYGIR